MPRPFAIPGLALLQRLRPATARALALLAALLVTGLLWLVMPGALHNMEERLGDLGWRLSSDSSLEGRVTIVEIDEKSIAELGPWPWPRETMARLSGALDEAGVQLQLYDVVFPEPREGDQQLLDSLQAGNAVLAQVPVLSGQSIQTGLMTHSLSGISCAAGTPFPATDNFVANNAFFASVPKGHIAPIVSVDGAIRRVPAAICVQGQAYPVLAISALLAATGREAWDARLRPGSGLLDPALLLSLEGFPGLNIPLDAEGGMRLSYERVPEAYRAVSAVDVINGDFDPDLFDNTWALVGATYFGSGDVVPTPYSGEAPGVELQARMLGSLLDASIPYTPRSAPLLLILLGAGFAGLLLLLSAARERIASIGLPLAAVLLPGAALLLHLQLLSSAQLWLGWLAPAMFGLLGAALLMLVEHARVRSERSRVYHNLHSYLPGDIAAQIAYSLPSSAIHARRCEVTLLSADLRNFSAYTERRPPEESAALLHYFFTRATRIIERHHGRVHEFQGDGLLAVWDGNDTRAAQQALAAARDMQAEIQEVLPQNPPDGLEPMALGIGIEQGPALIGSIGPAHRRSYTLLGDTVTITLRIQEMTMELAQPILLGACAARQLEGEALESQGSYLLTGLRTPQVLFAPPLPADTEPAEPVQRRLSFKVLEGGRH